MSILVDSDILIEVMRQRDPVILDRWLVVSSAEYPGQVCCSPVSVCELWQGVRPSETVGMQALFDSLVCLPIDEGVGQAAGKYMGQFAKSHSLQIADALIAAAAVRYSATLWTRNKKHYPMKDVTFFR